jgi:hypothetical protein
MLEQNVVHVARGDKADFVEEALAKPDAARAAKRLEEFALIDAADRSLFSDQLSLI